MAEPSRAGLTLSYAPTEQAITSPVIAVDESGTLVAMIPAAPLWSQLIPRTLHLSLAMILSAGVVWFAALLWREADSVSGVHYVSTALAAAMLGWILSCVRGLIVVCRFGHRPTVITVSAQEVSVTYVSDRGPRTRAWAVEDLVGLLLTERGKTLTRGMLWQLAIVASWPSEWSVFHLRFFARDNQFPTRLDEALRTAFETAKGRRVVPLEEQDAPELR